MNLLYPLGLLGLLSLPVIIGLHLHLDRRRSAVVSSLFLWKFLDRKLSGRTPRFLRWSWLLAVDLLIAGLLSLALAQPQLEVKSPLGESTQVMILLDTSTSMLTKDIFPSRFAAAKDRIYGLIDSLVGDEVITFITISGAPQFIGDTRDISQIELKSRVDALAAGGTGMDLTAGLALVEAYASEKRPVEVYIFSDGAFDQVPLDSFPFPIQWNIVGNGGNNQAVSDVELVETSLGEYKLFANLLNFSLQERDQDVRVIVDGDEVFRTEFSLPPESTAPFTLSLLGELDYVRVELAQDDLLAEDNYAGLGWVSPATIHAALVTDRPAPLGRAIRAVPDVDLEIISPADYSYASDFDVTVFREFLPSQWPDGLILVVDPPPDTGYLPISGVRSTDEPIEVISDPLTAGLNFSGVRWGGAWGISNWKTDFSMLMRSGQSPILLRTELQRGELVIFLAVLDLGNLTQHPSFPLLISNVVESARRFNPEQDYLIGDEIYLPDNGLQGNFKLIDPGAFDIDVPKSGEVRLVHFGKYSFSWKDDLGQSELEYFGVNAGSPEESNVRPRDWVLQYEDTEIIPKKTPTLIIDLAPWLLSLVVVLILLEAWRAWR